MPISIKPTSQIKARLGINPDGRVIKFLTNECAKKMDKYVPKDEGILRLYKIEGNKIIYDQPYARYQYYGVREDGTHRVQNYTTAGTGPYWDEKMKTADLPDIMRKAQQRFGGK